MNHHITKTATEVLWDFLIEIAPLMNKLILCFHCYTDLDLLLQNNNIEAKNFEANLQAVFTLVLLRIHND